MKSNKNEKAHPVYAKMTHTQCSPKELSAALFNPLSRTATTALASLAADIRANGILAPIHVIRTPGQLHPYMIVDGHRRWTIASEDHHPTVEIIIHEVSAAAAPSLWARLNRNTRTVNSLEWLTMWLASGRSCDKDLPNTVMSHIRRCAKILGDTSELQRLVVAKMSPSMCERVDFAHNAFMQKEASVVDRRTKQKIPSKKVIANWCIQHKGVISTLDSLRSIGRSGVPTTMLRKLLVRINRNEACTIAELMPKPQSARQT